MDARFKYVNEGIDRVVNILIRLEKRLDASHEDHERRIRRLEKHAGLVEA
jgi:hypothetical protein